MGVRVFENFRNIKATWTYQVKAYFSVKPTEISDSIKFGRLEKIALYVSHMVKSVLDDDIIDVKVYWKTHAFPVNEEDDEPYVRHFDFVEVSMDMRHARKGYHYTITISAFAESMEVGGVTITVTTPSTADPADAKEIALKILRIANKYIGMSKL